MRRSRRTLLIAVGAVVAVGTLTACSSDITAEQKQVDEAVLLPQSLFPNGPQVSECPTVPDGSPEDTTGGVPKAVCLTITNSEDSRAIYTVPVTVQSNDDDPVVISQVTITTSPIEAGATGAAAAAAPGTEKVIDAWADGQQDAQEAQGYYVIDNVRLKIGDVVRAAM